MPQNLTREEFKGDFLGFTFDDYHSSVFGIVRTSQSNRYNENLLPTMQDKTVQVPGGDGTYYFGSYYTQKPFIINFAFDSMTEKQLRRLKEVFGDGKIHDLIFDEIPYKIYSAKCTGTPNVKYLCFDEKVEDKDGNLIYERRYKGEGTLQFTAYYPFARSRFKFLKETIKISKKDLDGNKTNSNIIAENLLKNINCNYQGLFPSEDTIPEYKTDEIVFNITNYGDKESWFELSFPTILDSNDKPHLITHSMKIYLYTDKTFKNYKSFLHIRPLLWEELVSFDLGSSGDAVTINSKKNTIEFTNAHRTGNKTYYKSTGRIYNKLILEGSFFQIPKGVSVLKIVPGDEYIKENPDPEQLTLTKLPTEVDLNYSYLYY